MQNINEISYLNKIINIKSEILFREAEDDFYYFNKINSAYKKLKKAVELTENHLKSIILLADICFIKGYTKKSLNLYLKANKIKHSNPKILSGISNCYNKIGDLENSLKYCEKALKTLKAENNELFNQLIEIKTNILIEKKYYKKAFLTLSETKNILRKNSQKFECNINFDLLNEKLKLQKKLQKSNLKII